MKFATFVAISALAVSATAISTQAREAVDKSIQKDKDLLWRYCSQEGQPCAHVTKAVEKASKHLTYPDIGRNTTERSACYSMGGACQIAKRSAEALASAAAEAYAKANPEPKRRWCHLVGEPCLRKREPEPTAEPVARHLRFCHLVGEPCLKVRRSALPAPAPVRKHRWCHLVGEPCLKLRSAVDEIGTALYRRSADPEPHRRWCHLVGEPCLKARSIEEPVSDEDIHLHARCNESGGPCNIAKRAAEDLAFAATTALEQAGLDPSASFVTDDDSE